MTKAGYRAGLLAFFAVSSSVITCPVLAQQPTSRAKQPPARSKASSEDVKALREENNRLKQELESLRAAVAGLQEQIRIGGSSQAGLAIKAGTAIEYGCVLFEKGRKQDGKKISFEHAYESPPLVLVCESGTSGSWVVVKSERVTTRQAEIAVRGHRDYECRIAYVIIGKVATPIDARTGAEPTQTASEGGGQSAERKPTAPRPDYTVLDERMVDAPAKAEVSLSILVSGDISRQGLRALLLDLYEVLARTKRFTYHSEPTNVFICAFLTRAHFESLMGQWVAMLRKTPGDQDPCIMFNEAQLEGIGAKPERRFGRSEDERKRIFCEMVKAQYRAWYEAQQRYPMPDPTKPGFSDAKAKRQWEKAGNLEERLLEKYRDQVARQTGLTREQLSEIMVEATVKDWPLPPAPPEILDFWEGRGDKR